jgi:His Kinase A (phospho-acceptor) domain
VNEGDSAFAAIAHEVKTPLAVLRGFAELVAHRGDEETRREAAPALLEAAENLSSTINDLLLAFEIDSGAVEAERQPVELAGLLPANGALPTILGDRALLRRALETVTRDADGISADVEDGFAAIRVIARERKPLELYLARRIAELHGGGLAQTPDGVCLTLPVGD